MTDKFQDKSQVIEAELTPQDEEFLKEIRYTKIPKDISQNLAIIK